MTRERKTAIRAKSFRAWFQNNLREYSRDIALYGADAGYPHITYNTDAARVFDKFSDEIWEMLRDDADDMGEANPAAMLASFARADMLESWLTTKVLLVWYACERTAREMNPNL